MSTLAERMDAFVKAREAEETIRCPYCQSEHIDADHDFVSYYGYDDHGEEHAAICGECDREFRVREYVRRTYTTRKLD